MGVIYTRNIFKLPDNSCGHKITAVSSRVVQSLSTEDKTSVQDKIQVYNKLPRVPSQSLRFQLVMILLFWKHSDTFISYCFIEKLHSSCIFISGDKVVSADFDFTLLYRLIRNLLTTIPAPTYGCCEQSSLGHLNEVDIEKIRDFRNFLANSSNLEIDDKDFSFHWTNLSQVK